MCVTSYNKSSSAVAASQYTGVKALFQHYGEPCTGQGKQFKGRLSPRKRCDAVSGGNAEGTTALALVERNGGADTTGWLETGPQMFLFVEWHIRKTGPTNEEY